VNLAFRCSFIFSLITYLAGFDARASPYFEVGTSLGSVSNGDAYFQQTAVSGSSFVSSFNFYVPLTPVNYLAHVDLGLQNRLTSFTPANSESLAMASTNLAMRVEFWRFYAGGGYSPLTFLSSPGGGITGLHSYKGSSAYFWELGVIWRIIPEFQIALCYGRESVRPKGGGTSLSSSEYGLRFRFPLSPKEGGSKGEVKFDGFRYPFGFMK
jgi:hypothetical protein